MPAWMWLWVREDQLCGRLTVTSMAMWRAMASARAAVDGMRIGCVGTAKQAPRQHGRGRGRTPVGVVVVVAVVVEAVAAAVVVAAVGMGAAAPVLLALPWVAWGQ